MIRNKYDYIRKRYNVPVKHNGRVRVDGRMGTVRDIWGAQILVMLDGESWSRCMMPDDPSIEYEPKRTAKRLVDSMAGLPFGEVSNG